MMPSYGTGPLFDFQQVYADSLAQRSLDANKLVIAHPDVAPKLRTSANRNEETLSYVDAHSMGRRRDWASIEQAPHVPRVLVTTRNTARRDIPKTAGVANISAMTRSERIRLLEEMEANVDGKVERSPLDATPGTRLTARRAKQEHLLSGRAPFGGLGRSELLEAKATKAQPERTLHIKAAQQNPDREIDDGFSKSVELRLAALRGAEKQASATDASVRHGYGGIGNSRGVQQNARQGIATHVAAVSSSRQGAEPLLPDASLGSPGRRRYPKDVSKRSARHVCHREISQSGEKHDVERTTACISELAFAVDEGGRRCSNQAALFVKLSDQLRTSAYILRPDDALRAVILLAQSVSLIESYERASPSTKHDAASCHEDAPASLRSSMEAILAAVAMRINAAEAPFVADSLLAMAETRVGRQEFLDAILGHMLWLLAAKPRSFQPQIVARIIWALGWMKVDGGADGEKLTVSCKDGNRRAMLALQARLLEILDDFLEEDIGTLAKDPTGGAHLGDEELRKVLHRAGRLQVGLRPESARFLSAMQRLEASARARLWEPFQAEVMPFMRKYCEQLVSHSTA